MTSPAQRPRAAPLFARLFEAMILRREFYERAAADPDSWRPAAAVVCVSALAYGAVMGSPMLLALIEHIGNWILPVMIFLELLRWLLATGAAHVASLLFARDRADFGRLLRCLGFAQAPKVVALLALAVDDSIALWITRLIGAWLFVSTVAAVRYALATGLARAIAIGVLGFVIESAFLPLVGALFYFLGS